MELVSSMWFYVFSALAIAAGMAAIFSKSVLYGVLFSMITFLCLAAIYILSFADFIGIAQLVIYVGGILILLLFGIMMTNKLSSASLMTEHQNKFWGIVFFTVVFTATTYFSSMVQERTGHPEITTTIPTLGKQLLTQYILAFELTGILLLIALVGAAYIAKRKETT